MQFLRNLIPTISWGTSKPRADILTEGEGLWWTSNDWTVGAGDTIAGESFNQDSILTSATCYACTKALAETVAGLPAMVYRQGSNRREEALETDAQRLLADMPNPEMDAFTFWELASTRVINSGNFFAEIQRDSSDRPIALWPIHPSRVTPRRDPEDGSLYWEVSNDYTNTADYEDPTFQRRPIHYLSPHQMLNIVGFGSRNGIISPGMLPGKHEISIDFAARRYGAEFFRSGGVPPGVVEYPNMPPNPQTREEMRRDLNSMLMRNRHQIPILWNSAKWNAISVSPEQAQFLETRKFTADQICKFYGVPPAIIGDYEHSKFATADAMIRAFVMITLRNLVIRMEKAIYRQILNVTQDGKLTRAFTKPYIYRFAIDGLLRGDPKSNAETWAIMRQQGVASANEWRADLDMNPIDGEHGDYLIVNGGVARLDRIDEQGNRPGNHTPEENTAQLPQFDRQKLAEAILPLAEQAEQQHSVSVRGSDVVVSQLAEHALRRIHAITLSQIERWREQDPAKVAAKMPEFFAKQRERLTEALEPCDIAAGEDVSSPIVEAYCEAFDALDNYTIFDVSRHPNIETLLPCSC
jgi:HK97 family phage portal protein